MLLSSLLVPLSASSGPSLVLLSASLLVPLSGTSLVSLSMALSLVSFSTSLDFLLWLVSSLVSLSF